ncbi:similar to Saccharomyces cerevisiae YPL096W PNG1 Conserved peptide N-glycanase required for deglycosylation of misfolded glycoproteins during proteasome-dependent degradation [Maudiozyma barnettii]|uniref:Peptide-N(4)-(N-acetyl-beta-glucosaminyl)asparagine amidase n=1 Tax=Maudiozyma barnettii TaxID=61262 RepID=A0A8H2VHJ5_9SACH|nr:peptide-N4-(N-acetyl-beta-glucosaminyl)asparagine amidase [Kazachstania barnettii]CAB4255791.1 similar to Saccharomyces cerevisiae YPL096W PNG1 Conserved peptide N-glycanase required for deglycosylation of misfolded glycoproteins during proteasome-dependent degradation [Kazachstania barnettii]CAD1784352.1 similar to Saccharomyces cerevisiae YPL096W PNG1 Conserved peptide N-glycanase required for deglycosylation of misfolded glycoproteins during proteasome-dependent degradation [Kazachstania ba
MTRKTIVYEKAAKSLLERHKQRVIDHYHREGTDQEFITRMKSLISSNQFANDMARNSVRLCHVYENPDWHTKVMDTLDIDRIYKNVDEMTKDDEDEYTDNLVKELLRYFKNDFFKWVNAPPCVNCHNIEFQQFKRSDRPNSIESQHDCSGVEVYQCGNCKVETRFPRYNDPLKLLETRQGRCGEWCNVFTLILRSFGLEARYVWNKEDHVWCEYYSSNLKRWIHVDSCEASFDEPFIYSVNWNKKMSYCIAFNKDGVCDVSHRYLIKNQLPRTAISEKELSQLCEFFTSQLRGHNTDDNEIYSLYNRDVVEQLSWIDDSKKKKNTATTISTATQGRQSGSAEWTAQRGEDGK